MIFNIWEEQKSFLIQFQKDVQHGFCKDDYNVFIFGSFVTDEYRPDERNIPFDLIDIHLCDKGAFVNIMPLQLDISVTDYRSEDLNIYLRMLKRDYIYYRNESDYFLNFRRLNNL